MKPIYFMVTTHFNLDAKFTSEILNTYLNFIIATVYYVGSYLQMFLNFTTLKLVVKSPK